MKKILPTIVAVCLLQASFALAQNTFPSSGNVEIGTSTPQAKISFNDVNDNSEAASGITWFNGNPRNYGIYRTTGSWVGPGYQQLKLSWDTGIVLETGTGYSNAYVDVKGGGLRVTSGNVGVGTPSPSAKLDVFGTAKFGGSVANIDRAGNPVAYQDLAGTGKLLIGWNRTGGSGESDFVANEGGGSAGGFAFYSYSNTSQEKQLLRILGDGKVGIGTDSPREMLSVNGKIRAHEVKVEVTGWPDYVFLPGYTLMSILAMDAYIKENSHLPHFSSAKEVENTEHRLVKFSSSYSKTRST